MRRTYPLTLNEAIDIRQALYSVLSSPYPLNHIRTSWVGMCEEITNALYDSAYHRVERHEGRLYIWRDGYGYAAPHFVEVGGGAFCCPYWNYDRKEEQMGPYTVTSLEEEIVEVFMRRDGMSRENAIERFKRVYANAEDAICRGASIEAVEDIWMLETGLEPDYLYGIFYFA